MDIRRSSAPESIDTFARKGALGISIHSAEISGSDHPRAHWPCLHGKASFDRREDGSAGGGLIENMASAGFQGDLGQFTFENRVTLKQCTILEITRHRFSFGGFVILEVQKSWFLELTKLDSLPQGIVSYPLLSLFPAVASESCNVGIPSPKMQSDARLPKPHLIKWNVLLWVSMLIDILLKS